MASPPRTAASIAPDLTDGRSSEVAPASVPRRSQPKISASGAPRPIAASEPSDWGSLLADLARNVPAPDAPVEWRIHDRTHLEAALDFPIACEPRTYRWEAYFFVPESFRLDENTYDKKAIYEDLHSYVRLAVPSVPLSTLADLVGGSALFALRASVGEAAGLAAGAPQVDAAVRRARLFACRVRAASSGDMRGLRARVVGALDAGAIAVDVEAFAARVGCISSAFRAVMREFSDAPLADDLRVAMRWVDEDISLVLESVCASLGLDLQRVGNGLGARGERLLTPAKALRDIAAAESRHRAKSAYPSIAHADATPREMEQVEWRRHMLKRFTSSVLWLTLEVRAGAGWLVQLLYAVAAATSMGVAFAATVSSGVEAGHLFKYAVLVTVSYAFKDRLKAGLQVLSARWISRRFPDRRWTIRDRERARDLGTVHERAGFMAWARLPADVLALRRTTREHTIEEKARPESVLWHHKRFEISPEAALGDVAAPMLTEIFRLNLEQWLAHTDDPKRKVAFADPTDGQLYAMTARRVYNINVVYRLATEDESGAPVGAWHRLRLVVSRKGIERLDAIC